jgi:hypothetical protein
MLVVGESGSPDEEKKFAPKRSKVRKKATKSQLARWMATIGGLRMRLVRVATLLFVEQSRARLCVSFEEFKLFF